MEDASINSEQRKKLVNAGKMHLIHGPLQYSKRMQKGQNFWDDESMRYGFSWRFSKITGVIRMSILCLITSLASIALWFVAYEAERIN